MATNPSGPKTSSDWEFCEPPLLPTPTLVNLAYTICVRVKNNGTDKSIIGFQGEVHTYGAQANPYQHLIQEGPGSQFISLRFPVAPGAVATSTPKTPNNTATVQPLLSGSMLGAAGSQNFGAVTGGSGSASTGACQDTSACSGAMSEVLQEGRPVPVALSAEFGAPGASGGGPRVQAAILVYSGAPGFERCWFSQPLDLCSDGADPALWMLERTDAWTWMLRLRRGGLDLVVYRHTAAVEKDGTLPVQLRFVWNADGRSADWPPTVTLSPAP